MPAARLNLCPEIASMLMTPTVPSASKASLLCLAAFTAGLWAGDPPEPDALASAFAGSQAVYIRNTASAAERKARQRERDSHRDNHAASVTVTPLAVEPPMIPIPSQAVDNRDSHRDSHKSTLIKEDTLKEERSGEEPSECDSHGDSHKAPRFQKPTVDEVRAYCAERRNGIDAQSFIDFYESKGWMIGKNHMKDWKAAVRTWERMRTGSGGYSSGAPRAAIANPAGGREGQFDGLW